MLTLPPDSDLVVLADNAAALRALPDGAFACIYVDPPFNTGKIQRRRTMRATKVESGGMVGFNGARHTREVVAESGYADIHDDYLGFLIPRLAEARRLLAEDGTLYVHLDPRESHHVKVALDEVYGRDAFVGEIVWAYDFGGRPRDRFAPKHDTILVYAKDPDARFFSFDEVDRIPYMAPGLVGPEKAARGKLPTDVWWHTIVPTNSREKTGYPNQKPLGVVRRAIAAATRPGDRVLDFFAGSGTTAAAARELGRRFVMIDANPEAVAVMRARLGEQGVTYVDEQGAELP
jgi:site-specific DNA-methyltransferase (adenine-specific)